MLLKIVVLSLSVVSLGLAQNPCVGWVQTPFGKAWCGPGPMPALSTPITPVDVPTPPPFVPTFLKNVTVSVQGSVVVGVNEWYFATPETAAEICKRLSCAVIISKPFGGQGGPVSASAEELWLVWPDGASTNAGLLAGYFVRNPEDKFPGVALSLIKSDLKR